MGIWTLLCFYDIGKIPNCNPHECSALTNYPWETFVAEIAKVGLVQDKKYILSSKEIYSGIFLQFPALPKIIK